VQRGEERRQARASVAETARRAWQRVRWSAEAKCERVGGRGDKGREQVARGSEGVEECEPRPRPDERHTSDVLVVAFPLI
jgi:hypothetical protein